MMVPTAKGYDEELKEIAAESGRRLQDLVWMQYASGTDEISEIVFVLLLQCRLTTRLLNFDF